MRRMLVLASVAMVVVCLVGSGAAQEKGIVDKGAREARTAAWAFLKALLKGDIEAAMKPVHVPFLDQYSIEKDRDNLKKLLDERGWGTGQSEQDYEFKAVYTPRSLPETLFRLPPPNIFPQRNKAREPLKASLAMTHERLKAFLEPTDRVVIFHRFVRLGVAVVVRVREGKTTIAGLTFLSWLGKTFGAKKPADKQRDVQAKEAAAQFVKGFWRMHDIDAVMKTVTVPFSWSDSRKPISKDLDGLKNELEETLRQYLRRPRPRIEEKWEGTYHYGEFGNMAVTDYRRLQGILEDTDRIVIFGFSEEADKLAVMVRLRGDMAKVAGFRVLPGDVVPAP